MTNEEMGALILPWAKEHRPDPYKQTIAVSGNAATFRAYLIRLIEVRWDAEPDWRPQVPLRALEETALTVRMRHPGLGVEIDVEGRLDPTTRRPREGRQFSFQNMAEALEAGVSFAEYHKLVTEWDLVMVEP